MHNKAQYAAQFASSSKSRQASVMGNATIYMIIISILALVLSVISVYSVLLSVFALLPGLVAMIIDQDRHHYISKIVILYNITGLAPYLVKILRSSSPNSIAIDIIVDPHSWLVIFSSAALGWIIYWVFPAIAIAIYNLKINLRTAELEAELKKLAAEWGNEIVSFDKE